MKDILVKGYYGVHNLGDDIILNAIMKSLGKVKIDSVKIIGGGSRQYKRCNMYIRIKHGCITGRYS